MAKLPCYVNQLSKSQFNQLMNQQVKNALRQWIGQQIRNGSTIANALDAANLQFFGGQAIPKYLESVLPRKLANAQRYAEAQQRLAQAGNQVAQQYYGKGMFGKFMQK